LALCRSICKCTNVYNNRFKGAKHNTPKYLATIHGHTWPIPTTTQPIPRVALPILIPNYAQPILIAHWSIHNLLANTPNHLVNIHNQLNIICLCHAITTPNVCQHLITICQCQALNTPQCHLIYSIPSSNYPCTCCLVPQNPPNSFNLIPLSDIWQQPAKELDAIKKALDVGFEYIDFPLGYKYVKGQVVVVLKSRGG